MLREKAVYQRRLKVSKTIPVADLFVVVKKAL
jgi:hypothetical protein